MNIDSNSAARRSPGFLLGRLAAMLAGLLLVVGCGGTQMQPGNQRLTSSLRTAVSARNTQWLEQNVTVIEQRRREGQLTDEEYEALTPVVALARAGKWQEAEEAVVELQKSQRPSQEQVDELQKSLIEKAAGPSQ